MKYTHDPYGLLFEKLQVSSSRTHYQMVSSDELRERIKDAMSTGDYSSVWYILVRTTELMQVGDGEVYGRYCPLEVVLERTPYFAVEAKEHILEWLAESSQPANVNPKPSFLRRLAARLEALADRLETR